MFCSYPRDNPLQGTKEINLQQKWHNQKVSRIFPGGFFFLWYKGRVEKCFRLWVSDGKRILFDVCGKAGNRFFGCRREAGEDGTLFRDQCGNRWKENLTTSAMPPGSGKNSFFGGMGLEQAVLFFRISLERKKGIDFSGQIVIMFPVQQLDS